VTVAFAKQISKGGPVTVSHPNASRYFMFLADAVDLILSVLYSDRSGGIFVPAVGPPSKIVDIARTKIEENRASEHNRIVLRGYDLETSSAKN